MTSANAKIVSEIGLGARAPDAELADDAGSTVFLSSYWEEQPLVLVILDDLKPVPSVDHVLTLRDAHETFDEAGGSIVVIARDMPAGIAAFRAKHKIGWPVLGDPSGEAHDAYGVPPNGPASFVIDTGGVVRYAHRAATALAAPSTWDMVDAVCGLTGEVVERPDPAKLPARLMSLHKDAAERPALVTKSPVEVADQANYSCGKCGNTSYELVKLATAGGWLSRMFNFQYRKFVAVVCTACNYAELYRTKGGAAANIADILAGG